MKLTDYGKATLAKALLVLIALGLIWFGYHFITTDRTPIPEEAIIHSETTDHG